MVGDDRVAEVQCVDVVSFADVAPGMSARSVVLGGRKYISAIDFVGNMTGKDSNECSHILRRLPDWFKKLLEPHAAEYQFAGNKRLI